MNEASRPVIDIHAHDIPKELILFLKDPAVDAGYRSEEGSQGFTLVAADGRRLPLFPEFYDPEAKLRDMASQNIDVSYVSISPLLFSYQKDPGLAEDVSRAYNDGAANLAEGASQKIRPMATVPLQDAQRAVRELERCARVLHMGAVEVGTHVNGMKLSDAQLTPFWEAVAALGLLVFVHPHTSRSTKGLEGYYLSNLIGNPLETTLAIADVLFSGLRDRFPSIPMVFSHGGGYAPYQVGRFRHGYAVRPEARVKTATSPEEAFAGLYFDTITHNEKALRFLIDLVGEDHVLMGTDMPYDMGDRDPVRFVKDVADEREQQAILGGNAARLLPSAAL